MFIIGGILILWGLDENKFEALHTVPPVIALVLASVFSFTQVHFKDLLFISLPTISVCLVMICVIMGYSCNSVWPLAWIIVAVF